jgi:hypothetical protein
MAVDLTQANAESTASASPEIREAVASARDAAETIAENTNAFAILSKNDSQKSEADQMADSAVSPANGSDRLPLFETNRAMDLAYCLHFMETRISAYNAKFKDRRSHLKLHSIEHKTKASLYGVVDMMFCVGNYQQRQYASDIWGRVKKAKEKLSTESRELSSRRFYETERCQGQQMDFCTLAEFFDHVLEHRRHHPKGAREVRDVHQQRVADGRGPDADKRRVYGLGIARNPRSRGIGKRRGRDHRGKHQRVCHFECVQKRFSKI